MATIRAAFQDPPFRTQRMVEWSIVALVVVLIVLVFAHKVRQVGGYTERGAVQLRLGALRTAFLIDYTDRNVASWSAAPGPVQTNPFKLLQHYPVDYLGEMSAEQATEKVLAAPVGAWVYDPVCVCVGYLPTDTEWLTSPSGSLVAWYRVTTLQGSLQGSLQGPLQLTAKENYRWQGLSLN